MSQGCLRDDRRPFDSPGPKNIGVKTANSLDGENGPPEDDVVTGTIEPVDDFKCNCRGIFEFGLQPGIVGENPLNGSSSNIIGAFGFGV